MSDIGDALAIYRAIGGVEQDGTEHLAYCIVPGNPVSKSRARFGKGQVYSRPEARAAELRTATFVRAALLGHKYPGNVALGCIFYRSSFQRVDVDNMLKHVCDAINGVAFKDDSQVTAIFGRGELDRENPRTVIVLGPHRSTLVRSVNDSTPCQKCGAPISAVAKRGFREPQRYCSRACMSQARAVDLSEPVPCAQCGTPFRRSTSYRTLCSPECRVERLRNSRKAKAQPYSDCATCGKQLTHHRGGRCRDCWRANPSERAA